MQIRVFKEVMIGLILRDNNPSFAIWISIADVPYTRSLPFNFNVWLKYVHHKNHVPKKKHSGDYFPPKNTIVIFYKSPINVASGYNSVVLNYENYSTSSIINYILFYCLPLKFPMDFFIDKLSFTKIRKECHRVLSYFALCFGVFNGSSAILPPPTWNPERELFLYITGIK